MKNSFNWSERLDKSLEAESLSDLAPANGALYLFLIACFSSIVVADFNSAPRVALRSKYLSLAFFDCSSFCSFNVLPTRPLTKELMN